MGIYEWTPAEILRFLRAGGRFGPSDWVLMDEDTREAVRVMNVRLEEERATLIITQATAAASGAVENVVPERPAPEDPIPEDPLPRADAGRFPVKIGGE